MSQFGFVQVPTFGRNGPRWDSPRTRTWAGRGTRWEYLFWVDLDADVAQPAGAAALADLAREAEMVRILGTYPRAAED